MSRDTKSYLRPLKYQEKNRINEAKKEAEIARKEDEDFKNLSIDCQNKYYNEEKEILEHNKRVHEQNKYTTGPEEPKKKILTKKIFFEKYCKKINDRYICLTDEELKIKEQQKQQEFQQIINAGRERQRKEKEQQQLQNNIEEKRIKQEQQKYEKAEAIAIKELQQIYPGFTKPIYRHDPRFLNDMYFLTTKTKEVLARTT
jgi:hypothetical protein